MGRCCCRSPTVSLMPLSSANWPLIPNSADSRCPGLLTLISQLVQCSLDGSHPFSIRTRRARSTGPGRQWKDFQPEVLNAILYVAEHRCKWRGLPARFGNWHTVYTSMKRWSKIGVLDRVFEYVQLEQVVRIRLEAASMDSTIVKVHADGTAGPGKTVPNPSAASAADGPPTVVWLPRMLEPPSRSRQVRPAMARKVVSC